MAQVKQLLKWIGNKHRFADEIVSYMPNNINRYIEPFLGSGAVLANLSATPNKNYETAIAGDLLTPLIEIFKYVQDSPQDLINHYTNVINEFNFDRNSAYLQVRERFNQNHNPLDFMVLSRTCYSGVVRFRKTDGYMSTPIGPHKPIPPEEFEKRVYTWNQLIKNVTFLNEDFRVTMGIAEYGDLVYCDPPYTHSQTIIYGSQSFSIDDLWNEIDKCKSKGIKVMLSLNGERKAKIQDANIKIPDKLFARKVYINCGISMINRLQKNGENMSDDRVHDLLLLTW